MLPMLLLFAALAGGFSLLERRWPWRWQPKMRTGLRVDAGYLAISLLMRTTLNGAVALALCDVARHALIRTGLTHTGGGLLERSSLLTQCFILLLVLDFVFYVTHRLKHQVPWLWRLHETHHSATEIDFLTATRLHPLETLLDRTLYLLPLLVLGPSENAVLVWATVDAAMGMLIHTNANLSLGPLILLVNGPEMHRWHHSRDELLRQFNFGNNFSIFDWIFGTAYVNYAAAVDFGLDDVKYPQDSIVEQFLYAFRPEPTATVRPVEALPEPLRRAA